VRSPLPGKIIDLRVKAGDTVSKGQALLVLEAMKMEHTLAAPTDGKIKSVRYAVGEQVAEGAELVEFEES
jgi:3-methylcrotonyl-CoA carboxylase alpha subunit